MSTEEEVKENNVPKEAEEEEEDEVEAGDVGGETTEKAKSKKKRKKKKKPSAAAGSVEGTPGDPAASSGTKDPNQTKSSSKSGKNVAQTNPPSIPIKDLFPKGDFPIGEILEHPTLDK